MMIKRWFVPIIIIALFLLLGICGSAFGSAPFKIDTYVTDQAGLLSETERSQLAAMLDNYARATSNQILVVTIPSLEDGDLVDFTEKLFELNKPGQKGKDNGLIFLIALKEHQVRLEVGYGLEALIPDGKAGAIIREQITPFFKNNDYYGGISNGINTVISAITPGYAQNNNIYVPVKRRTKDHSFPVAFLVAIVIFIISIFGNIGRNSHVQRSRHRRGFSEPWYWGGGGYGGGGFGGGSSGFGDGGGGGFSGGGGSFGGGGASGSW